MRESKACSYEDIDAQVCPRCGLRGDGPHTAPGDRYCRGCPCIDAMRARIAELEFKLERAAQKRQAPAAPIQIEQRGGRRERKDNRFVLLDGERLTLAEAARRLGLTASALHFRILNRTAAAEYGEVDLRAIGADHVRGGGDKCSARSDF